jgi:hypothetical protein
MLAKNAKFDWYQSTVAVSCPEDSGLVEHLLKAWPFSDWGPAKNLNGYTHGGSITIGGRLLCHLCWGGQLGVNCKTSSDESHVLADALKTFGKTHHPTRVDSCIDWVEEGLFESLAGHLTKFAQDNRLAINQQGDWVRGEARTLYIGSKDSPVRLVIYEKGYEQGGDAPRDWVRMEARIRPKRQHRGMVATWDASTVFTAQWIPEALEVLGWGDLDKRSSVGTVWRKSDEERARAALVKQYGAVLARWADETGSWLDLGPAINAAIDKAAEQIQPPIHPTGCECAVCSTVPQGIKSPTDRAVTLPVG